MNLIRSLLFTFGWLLPGGWSLVGAQNSGAAQPILSTLAISPDGQTAAAAYRGDTVVLLFDLRTGLPRQCLSGYRRPVSFLTFSDDNSCLVSAGPDEVVRWRLPDFQLLDRTALALGSAVAATGAEAYDPARGLLYRSDRQGVYAVSLRQHGQGKILKLRSKAPAGKPLLLAQAPDREALWVLDPDQGELCRVELDYFRVQTRVTVPDAFALTADNQRLAVLCRPPADSADAAFRLELFDDRLEKQSTLFLPIDLPNGAVPRLTFAGPWRLTITVPGGIVDVDLRDGATSPFHWGYGYDDLFYRPNGDIWLRQETTLLLLDATGRLRSRQTLHAAPELLCDPHNGKCYRLDSTSLRDEQGQSILSLPPRETPLCAVVNNDILALGFRSGSVALYDLPEGRLRWELPAEKNVAGRLVPDPAGKRLAVQRDAFTVELRDLRDGRLIQRLRLGDPVTALAFDGRNLILGDRSGKLTRVEAEDGRPGPSYRVLSEPVTALCFAAEAGYWLLGSRGGVVACDTSCFEPQLRYRGHTGAVHRIEVMDDGAHFYSLGDDGVRQTWDIATERLLEDGLAAADGRPDWAIRGGSLLPDAGPANLSFSRQGALLAAWDFRRQRIDILETSSGQARSPIPVAPGNPMPSLTFFDEQDVLLVAAGATLEYWDPWTRQLLKRLDYPATGGGFGDVAKQTGRDVLWTFFRGGDRIVRLDATTGDVTGSFRIRPAGREAAATIHSLTLSDDGRRMAIVAQHGLYLYDTDTCDPVAFLPEEGLNTRGGGIWFSPDGNWVAFRRGSEIAVFDTYQDKVLFQTPGAGVVFLDQRHVAVYRQSRQQPSLFDIWDYLRGEPVGAVDPAQEEWVAAAALHAPTGRLATVAPDGAINWWRLVRSEASPPGKWLVPTDRPRSPAPGRVVAPLRLDRD